jgi:hypothetical protein
VSTKQQSRLEYSQSLMSISLVPGPLDWQIHVDPPRAWCASRLPVPSQGEWASGCASQAPCEVRGAVAYASMSGQVLNFPADSEGIHVIRPELESEAMRVTLKAAWATSNNTQVNLATLEYSTRRCHRRANHQLKRRGRPQRCAASSWLAVAT